MALKLEHQGGKIKPAGYPTTVTHEQYLEAYKCMNDPIYFIENYCWIISADLGRILFKLYPYQKQLVNHYNHYNKSICLIGRQQGKCAISATFLNKDGNKIKGGYLLHHRIKERIVRWLEEKVVSLAKTLAQSAVN